MAWKWKLFPRRLRRLLRFRRRLEPGHDILLPGGVCRNGRHHRIGRHGGTYKVFRLSGVQPRDVRLHLSSCRPLDLGWRTHRPNVNRRRCVLRLRRIRHRSHGRRYRCSHGSDVPRTSNWQILTRRNSPSHPWPQHPLRHPWCLHPLAGMVRVQPRFGACRRPVRHVGCGQHNARSRSRWIVLGSHHLAQGRQA